MGWGFLSFGLVFSPTIFTIPAFSSAWKPILWNPSHRMTTKCYLSEQNFLLFLYFSRCLELFWCIFESKSVFWLNCGFSVIIHVATANSCVVITVDFFCGPVILTRSQKSLSAVSVVISSCSVLFSPVLDCHSLVLMSTEVQFSF